MQSVAKTSYLPENKQVIENGKNTPAETPAIILQKYPELQRVIEAWPGLDVDTRQRIVSMVENPGNSVEKE